MVHSWDYALSTVDRRGGRARMIRLLGSVNLWHSCIGRDTVNHKSPFLLSDTFLLVSPATLSFPSNT
jgi:hypothetical protein